MHGGAGWQAGAPCCCGQGSSTVCSLSLCPVSLLTLMVTEHCQSPEP